MADSTYPLPSSEAAEPPAQYIPGSFSSAQKQAPSSSSHHTKTHKVCSLQDPLRRAQTNLSLTEPSLLTDPSPVLLGTCSHIRLHSPQTLLRSREGNPGFPVSILLMTTGPRRPHTFLWFGIRQKGNMSTDPEVPSAT